MTAGNASGVNDGACALIIASEGAGATAWPDAEGARRRGGDGRRGAAHHGHRPGSRDAQGARAGAASRSAQIDVIELNEAFASQALAVLRELGLPDDAAHVTRMAARSRSDIRSAHAGRAS